MRRCSTNAFISRVIVHALVACCCVASAFAQATRVTVVLVTGQRIDAVLKSATGSEFVVDDAGMERKFPAKDVAQVIVSKSPASPLAIREAFKAFRVLQDALAARELTMAEYPAHVDTLKRNAPFALGTGEWSDIRMAMKAALTEYENAKTDWPNAVDHWSRAAHDLSWARELDKNVESEREHLEDRTARPLRIGPPMTGRLGAGDRQITRDLDRDTAGAFNDLWTIDMRTSGTLLIEMSSNSVTPHLLLVNANGEKLDNQRAQFADATIRRRVSAGTYRIWAGASAPREVGSYTLQVTVQR